MVPLPEPPPAFSGEHEDARRLALDNPAELPRNDCVLEYHFPQDQAPQPLLFNSLPLDWRASTLSSSFSASITKSKNPNQPPLVPAGYLLQGLAYEPLHEPPSNDHAPHIEPAPPQRNQQQQPRDPTSLTPRLARAAHLRLSSALQQQTNGMAHARECCAKRWPAHCINELGQPAVRNGGEVPQGRHEEGERAPYDPWRGGGGCGGGGGGIAIGGTVEGGIVATKLGGQTKPIGKSGGGRTRKPRKSRLSEELRALPNHRERPKVKRERVFRECGSCQQENHIRRIKCVSCGCPMPFSKHRKIECIVSPTAAAERSVASALPPP